MTGKRFIVVDGSGYIFRAFFALHQGRAGGRNVKLSTSAGMPTGALFVFTNMLMRLYLDEKPELCAVVFDAPGRTFRHELYADYKANRREKPDELIPQLPWFEKIVRAFRLPVIQREGVEADDVIATLARRGRALGLDTVIYSGDKDLMQLVDDRVVVVDSMRDIRYDAARVKEKFGVPPERVGDFLALRGDSSDNIPGMPGVGEKTAAKLLTEFGSLDDVLAHTAELKGKLKERFQDPQLLAKLQLSRELVRLRDDVPLDEDVLELTRRDWDAGALRALFGELEFASFASRIDTVFESDRGSYRVIVDEAALDELLARARAHRALAVSWLPPDVRHGRDALVGLGLCTEGAAPAYVPLAHRYLGVPKMLPTALVMRKLADLLGDPAAAVSLYDHDHKTTWGLLAEHGVPVDGPGVDTWVAAHLLDASRTDLGLAALAKRHLAYDVIAPPDVLGKGKHKRSLEETDVASVAQLGAEAAHVTWALGGLLRERVRAAELTHLLDDVERPLSRVLAIMESNGIRVNPARLRELSQTVGEDCQKLERRIVEVAGEPLNVSSPKQLSELLFEKLGLRTERMRKTTLGFSTDHAVLEELRDAHPIVPLLIEHRELIKLKNTYLDALPPLIDAKTSRLHTSYSQAAASTGRLASTQPNLQNIPIRTALGKQIREAFVAEPGHLIISADYSQIELRVLAHLSGDAVLCQAFAHDVDVHAQTAAEVFDVPLAEVTEAQRRVAKAVNYGLGYGQTDFGLAQALDIPRHEARSYIERYFTRFAGVHEFMEKHLAQAHKTQMVYTLLGRRLPVLSIASKRYAERTAAERLARNAPIQGSAADILKLAMLKVQARFDAGAWPGKMLLTVHDELVFEVPEADAADLAEKVRVEMESAYALRVPLRVDVGMAVTWAQAH